MFCRRLLRTPAIVCQLIRNSLTSPIRLEERAMSSIAMSETASSASSASTSPAEKKVNRQPAAIFGLGNPGNAFVATRHNVGRDIVESLAKKLGAPLTDTMCSCRYSDVSVGARTVTLATPETMMNRSGRAVRQMSEAKKVYDKNVFVVFDDVDLPLGTIRLRNRGSSGGQNGVENVLRCLGASSRFVRIRVGIGRPSSPAATAEYVLKRFSLDEQRLVLETQARVHECIRLLLTEGLDAAMNTFNKSAQQLSDSERKGKDKDRKEKAAAEGKQDSDSRRRARRAELQSQSQSQDEGASESKVEAEAEHKGEFKVAAAPASSESQRKRKLSGGAGSSSNDSVDDVSSSGKGESAEPPRKKERTAH